MAYLGKLEAKPSLWTVVVLDLLFFDEGLIEKKQSAMAYTKLITLMTLSIFAAIFVMAKFNAPTYLVSLAFIPFYLYLTMNRKSMVSFEVNPNMDFTQASAFKGVKSIPTHAIVNGKLSKPSWQGVRTLKLYGQADTYTYKIANVRNSGPSNNDQDILALLAKTFPQVTIE